MLVEGQGVVNPEQVARSEEVKSAILEAIEECGQPMDMPGILTRLTPDYSEPEVRGCVWFLADERRLELTRDWRFGLPA